MKIKNLTLSNFRNYGTLTIDFDEGTNILYGDNAQGKTNLLEAIFLLCTTKSHKGSKDHELIRFGEDEAHLRALIDKEGATYRVDMHLKKGRSKGIALDGVKMRRAAELIEKLSVNVILFSPEDLGVIKEGPSARRRFLDLELCQLSNAYLDALSTYQKALSSRAKLLKGAKGNPDALSKDLLDVYDDPLINTGKIIIEMRDSFLRDMNAFAPLIHSHLTGGAEDIELRYEPKVLSGDLEKELKANRIKDIFTGMTNTGPHRDDFSFLVREKGKDKETDIRKYGSQGQQRTAALTLKLSEISLVKNKKGVDPVLLLDDVLSELDSSRQNALLTAIGDLQTIITCTGLDEFVNNNFAIDRLIRVKAGEVFLEKQVMP